MDDIVEKIHSLLFSNLVTSSPVLSGNMKSRISEEVTSDSMNVIIDAPFYDLEKWEKDKVIVHTGEVIDGMTAYAFDVNESGAFGRHNKSEGWVDRAILQVVNTIANEIGATVIYEI